MKKETYKTLGVVGIYAIAMAFLESVVVVYLRKIYYPQGFNFPLKGFIEPAILNLEWAREFFTIVMLATVVILAGKKFHERFAYFLYAFAVWDIFYYIWLKIILAWPSSLLTWDILFLIPLPWIGPVLAPVLLSLTMILLSLIILHFNETIKLKEWMLLIIGSLIILYTFMFDYANLIIQGGFAKDFFTLAASQNFIVAVDAFIPMSYNWFLFAAGEVLFLAAILSLYLRSRTKK
jgi:hypothetical protein